jgi:DNA segregation ATPase FtsK/SpoIIIE, S-DNA-T family
MPRRRRKKELLNPTLSRGIIAIILVIFSIIIALSFVDKAGDIGVILNKWILNSLFGSMRFATPVIILILVWFMIKDFDYDYHPTHGIGAFLFFLATASLFHIKYLPHEMWEQALDGNGGGVFGMLAWPLKEYLGGIAGIVILFGLAFISVFLIFNTSFEHFITINKKIFATLSWLGNYIFTSVKALFVKNRQEDFDEEELEDDEYEEEEEDEDVETHRNASRFASKKLNQEEFDDEDDDEEEENDEENTINRKPKTFKIKSAPTSATTGPWAKKIIIKPLPKTSLLNAKKGKPTSGDIKASAGIIKDTFEDFNIDVTMGEVKVGPTVTQYSLKPAKGVKISRITSLSNDLALALAAHPIRIEAPIPGKSLVGIEVPNEKTAMVTLKEILENKIYMRRPHDRMIGLGKDVAGKVWFGDLPKMPHLLVAGATGSGKTVCINTIIMSLLYQNTAADLRMIMVDPKRVELTLYNGIPHLLTPVITDAKKTVNALKWCIGEMDRRFETLAKAGSRDITSYNSKFPDNKLPHIVFIIDELADLMATAANEVESGIIRLAQMARAVGIHLIIATQRPSVDVITGLMKANIPARIAFSVASLIDSRTILDSPGAEKLLGRGDMLFQTAEFSKPIRIQGAFISENEVNNVVKYLKRGEQPEYDESITEKTSKNGGTANMFGGAGDDNDDLFDDAKQEILEAKKASASFLQRKLRIGYARAARILDELEEAGIIGPSNGAKPREILITGKDAGQNCNAFKEDVINDSVDEKLFEEEEDDEENDDELEEDDYEEEEEIDEADDYEDEDYEIEEEEDDEYEDDEDEYEEEYEEEDNPKTNFEY